MSRTENNKFLVQLKDTLIEDEKSAATIEKYIRDVRSFLDYVSNAEEWRERDDGTISISKNTVIQFKQYLQEHYEITSANSILAAVNYFLRSIGRQDCTVKSFRLQTDAFRAKNRELTKDEYLRLLEAARRKGNDRLSLLMQTICATGIRISELPFITVEALHTRRAQVSLKGKTRTVILPMALCKELKRYVKEKKITSGSVFVTRSGKALDRSNILHDMKKLCESAGVADSKVFPHNLRHLFAGTYYKEERDICHLADLLGHSSIDTTRIYTRISSEAQEEQVESLGLCLAENKITA